MMKRKTHQLDLYMTCSQHVFGLLTCPHQWHNFESFRFRILGQGKLAFALFDILFNGGLFLLGNVGCQQFSYSKCDVVESQSDSNHMCYVLCNSKHLLGTCHKRSSFAGFPFHMQCLVMLVDWSFQLTMLQWWYMY